MKCCVPKGRAIVLSGFCGETQSSRCRDEDVLGISALDSQRLVEEMIARHTDSTYKELQNCILNMVPTQRQLLLVFQTTKVVDSDSDVDKSNNLYWGVTRAMKDKNKE
eukprot:261542-Ditylum_brightwellii.AAC.1